MPFACVDAKGRCAALHSTLVGGMFNVVANACNYRQMMQNYLTEIAEIAHGSELTIEY